MNEKTLEELLHGIIALGIGAANLFVKNTGSRQQAGKIIDLVTTTVLPLADDLLSQQAAQAVPAPAVSIALPLSK